MIVHVRNFGKIESADIDLSSLVIFVGENNSGKTYLMQLIYGLFSFFYSIKSSDVKQIVQEINFDEEQLTITAGDSDFYQKLQDALNDCLDKRKNDIIKNTFHTNLSIDAISVEFDALEDDFSLIRERNPVIYKEDDEENKNLVLERCFILKNGKRLRSVGVHREETDDSLEKFISSIARRELIGILLSELTGFSIKGLPSEKPFIYLPASRSGLMLLYTDYLLNNEKNYSDKGVYSIESADEENTENKYGLTEPVYSFLEFLLKYKYSEEYTAKNKDIISFIDNHIINGHLEKVGNTMRYMPKQSEASLPIYLSSSLVSELSPIYQILSGIQRFSYIMYDEIETCQHPTKQLQLARLLIRMVNAGYKFIVSTHSDTMAACIGNLVTLSFKQKRHELISELGYEKEDILLSDNVNAYQFLVGENGKTTVEKVPSHFSLGVGFDFDLFNKTNDKIYQDAVKLSEVD